MTVQGTQLPALTYPVMPFQFFLALIIAATLWSHGAIAAPDRTEATNALFRQNLETLVKKSDLSAGVAIKDLTSGEEFLVNGDAVFPQGSAIRLHLIAELFRQAAAKKFSLDEPRPLPASARTGGSGVLRHMTPGTVSMSLRDYATLVITVNDNSAANFLTDVVGMENVNAALVAQGTPEIKFRRRAASRLDTPPAPENIGTPRSVMRALELLHRGAVVDRATSDAIIAVLVLPEASYFRRELPSFVPFAGRSGSGSSHRCEAGIVLVPKRPYVLCVMIKDLRWSRERGRNHASADALIGAVTRLAQEHFMPKGASPAQSKRSK